MDTRIRLKRYGDRVVRVFAPMSPRPDEHHGLRSALAEHAGQWVAVDRRTGRAHAARPTPYALSAFLKNIGSMGWTLYELEIRAPELIGLG